MSIHKFPAFSTSRIAWGKEGQGTGTITLVSSAAEVSLVDQELSAKVEAELQIEKEVKDGQQLPANLQQFLNDTPFEVRELSTT